MNCDNCEYYYLCNSEDGGPCILDEPGNRHQLDDGDYDEDRGDEG